MAVADLGGALMGGLGLGRRWAMDRLEQQRHDEQMQLAQAAAMRQDTLARMQMQHAIDQGQRMADQTDVARQTLDFHRKTVEDALAEKVAKDQFGQAEMTLAPQTKSKTAMDHFGPQVAAIQAKIPQYLSAPEVPQGVPSLLARRSDNSAITADAPGTPSNPWGSLAAKLPDVARGQEERAQGEAADASIWANSKPAIRSELRSMNDKLGRDVAAKNDAEDWAKQVAQKAGADAKAKKDNDAGLKNWGNALRLGAESVRGVGGANYGSIIRAERSLAAIKGGRATVQDWADLAAGYAAVSGGGAAHMELIKRIEPMGIDFKIAALKQFLSSGPVPVGAKGWEDHMEQVFAREKGVMLPEVRAAAFRASLPYLGIIKANRDSSIPLLHEYGISGRFDPNSLEPLPEQPGSTLSDNKWPGGKGGFTPSAKAKKVGR